MRNSEIPVFARSNFHVFQKKKEFFFFEPFLSIDTLLWVAMNKVHMRNPKLSLVQINVVKIMINYFLVFRHVFKWMDRQSRIHRLWWNTWYISRPSLGGWCEDSGFDNKQSLQKRHSVFSSINYPKVSTLPLTISNLDCKSTQRKANEK